MQSGNLSYTINLKYTDTQEAKKENDNVKYIRATRTNDIGYGEYT